MICARCGTRMREGARYCQRCGAALPGDVTAAPYGVPVVAGRAVPLPKGAAVAGLVCGILAVVFAVVPVLGLVLGICGTHFGTQGLRRANARVGSGKGLAVAGQVCGIVGTVWGAFYLILWAALGIGTLAVLRQVGLP